MHFEKQKYHMVDLLFTIALFCVFAVSSLSVILIGANVYRSVTSRASDTYSTRTVLSYIAQKFQSMDNGCPAELLNLDGLDTLALYQEYNGELFVTYIYEDGESLRELFTRADAAFDPGAGSTIMKAAGFRIEEVKDGIFYLQVESPGGEQAGVFLRPKSDPQKDERRNAS